jgi:hypothetical protein
MTRRCYKTALRAKGIKPIPPYHKLRTRKDTAGEHHEIVALRREIAPPPAMLDLGGRLIKLIRRDA